MEVLIAVGPSSSRSKLHTEELVAPGHETVYLRRRPISAKANAAGAFEKIREDNPGERFPGEINIRTLIDTFCDFAAPIGVPMMCNLSSGTIGAR